jgi:hypothetical protein
MSKVRSWNDKSRWAGLENIGRGFAYWAFAALPLFSLVLFFEITKPADVRGGALAGTELSSAGTGNGGAGFWPVRHNAIARLKGVSAELEQSDAQHADVISASDAQLALANAPHASLKTGFETEFVTKEHRRFAIRIIRRERIMDRAVPDNARLRDIVPASTANTVTFAWGAWLYVAEIVDKGPEPQVVVQEVL